MKSCSILVAYEGQRFWPNFVLWLCFVTHAPKSNICPTWVGAARPPVEIPFKNTSDVFLTQMREKIVVSRKFHFLTASGDHRWRHSPTGGEGSGGEEETREHHVSTLVTPPSGLSVREEQVVSCVHFIWHQISVELGTCFQALWALLTAEVIWTPLCNRSDLQWHNVWARCDGHPSCAAPFGCWAKRAAAFLGPACLFSSIQTEPWSVRVLAASQEAVQRSCSCVVCHAVTNHLIQNTRRPLLTHKYLMEINCG